MADHSELSTTDYEDNDRLSDTTATVPSADSAFLSPIPRNDEDESKESSEHSVIQSVIGSGNETESAMMSSNSKSKGGRHDQQQQQQHHDHHHHHHHHRRRNKQQQQQQSGGKHKSSLGVNQHSASPSPGLLAVSSSSSGSGAGKKRDNVAMRKILDAAPKMIAVTVDEEKDGDEHQHQKAVSRVLQEVYFEGNWNRGHYAVDIEKEEEMAESEEKEEIRCRGYEPLTVFTDDEMFKLLPSQRKDNRLDKGHFAPYQYRRSPFPLPSQRLKRALYPFKEWKNEEDQNADFKAKIDRLHRDEQDNYGRMRVRATNLKKLYHEVTKWQMVDSKHFENIHELKRRRWKEWTLNPPSSLGAVQESNIPKWVNGKNGWYTQSALNQNRNLRMPQHKRKKFKQFYPRTARWDRIQRGCFELDWGDEDVIMDIIDHDESKYKTPLEVVLSLRREHLFDDDTKMKDFDPFARDPFEFLYNFYGVAERVGMTKDVLPLTNTIWTRMRALWYTLNAMWFIASPFDPDGAIRVPAMVNPMEWTYVIALKLVVGIINRKHICNEKHCNVKDPTRILQWLKKMSYAFDFNEDQIYDFRYIGYLLRHTLFNQLFHALSKHAGKAQFKHFKATKKNKMFGVELVDDEDWFKVLDYFRFMVISNNMYEFFSPAQMGKLWEYLAGTFEEFRMMFPEISLTVYENEWCDFEETNRYASVFRSMPWQAYRHYFGRKFFDHNKSPKSNEKIWFDAHSIIKQYAIKNTLFPIPDIFESVYKSHDLRREMNPDLVTDESLLTETANRRYKEKKVKNHIISLVAHLGKVPEAFYLTEIKYPFLAQLLRACVKYQAQQHAACILRVVMTEAFDSFSKRQHLERLQQKSPTPSFYSSEYQYREFNEEQKRCLETTFTWPYILFIEYMVFNPKQFYREYLTSVSKEAHRIRADLERHVHKMQESENGDERLKRKLHSKRNQLMTHKAKYVAWEKAGKSESEPVYPFAMMLRFAVCERTNAKMDEGDHLEASDQELLAADFVMSRNVVAALQSMLKFPQFGSRVLLRTPNLKQLILDVAYNEFKTIYSAIFKYNPEYQEKPELYAQCKSRWKENGQSIKAMLDVFHSLPHRLHREKMWLGLYQFHQKCYDTGRDSDRDHLFDYYSEHHFKAIAEEEANVQNGRSVLQQERDFMEDVLFVFKQFGYSEDADHRFYGNYYRHFLISQEMPLPMDRKKSPSKSTEDSNDRRGDDDHDEMMSTEDEVTSDEMSGDDQHHHELESKEEVLETRNGDHDRRDSVNTEQSESEMSRDQEVGAVAHPQSVGTVDSENDGDAVPKLEGNARGSNEFVPEQIDFIRKGQESPLQNIDEHSLMENEDVMTPLEDQMGNGTDDQGQNQGQGQRPTSARHSGGGGGGSSGGGQDHNNGGDQNQNGHDGGFGFGAGSGSGGGGGDDGDKRKKQNNDDKAEEEEEVVDDDEKDKMDEDDEEEDDPDGVGALPHFPSSRLNVKGKRHRASGSDLMADMVAQQLAEQDHQILMDDITDNVDDHRYGDDLHGDDDGDLVPNIGTTVRQMTRGHMMGDVDGDEMDDHYRNNGQFQETKEWYDDLKKNPNIIGMQNRDAVLKRKEEQKDLYRRHQQMTMEEDQNEYSILDLEDTEFLDSVMIDADLEWKWGDGRINALVPDVETRDDENDDDDEPQYLGASTLKRRRSGRRGGMDTDDESDSALMGHRGGSPFWAASEAEEVDPFSDEKLFGIKAARWMNGQSVIDPVTAKKEDVDKSYVMLRDLTEPLALSDLLGDFQRAGQIMLSRIDDLQASLIVENKLHCGVLKAHQLDEKQLMDDKTELLEKIEGLEKELNVLREKRDENKSESAALKTKEESYILKYNELKDVSTQKLRDQLRCFEIYKAQTKQLEKRIESVEYQTEIGFKRHQRLENQKKQKQLNVEQLDTDMMSLERERGALESELADLESEQQSIDDNEKQYVERLKEQLRRLGKGMEQKERSCNIFRRNVVEERLRIHSIDDSLKKMRTNANPTTASDQERINATQHEALQAREKYAEKTQEHSLLANISQYESALIHSIERVQNIDDEIYAKKWNIIQKTWNLKKHLLEIGKLRHLKKYLEQKEKDQANHKRTKSQAKFSRDTQRNLSFGARAQFQSQSGQFDHLRGLN